MKVILVRHAKSFYDWSKYPTDDVRPLADKGRIRQEAVTYGMKKKNLTFSLIWCSPYTRAIETLEIIQRVYNTSLPVTTINELVPGGDEQNLLTLVREEAKIHPSATLLMVGHNPLLSSFLELMSTNEGLEDMKTSDVALCEVTDSQARLLKFYPRKKLID